jgi:hypothetical protein
MRKTVADGNENELCGEEGMATGEWKWALRGGGNENGRTRNGSVPLTALLTL